MAEQLRDQPPPANPSSNANPSLPSEFDSLLNSDPHFGLGFEGNTDEDALFGDIELTFDDLDDLYFPADDEELQIPESGDSVQMPSFQNPDVANCFKSCYREEINCSNEASRATESEVSGDRGSDVGKFLNSPQSESGSHDFCGSDKNNVARPLDFTLPESGSSGRGISGGSVSSQGSGNCGSGVSEATNSPCPDSENLDRDVVDQMVKVEEGGPNFVPKRKKEPEDVNVEGRTSKYRRASTGIENSNSHHKFGAANEEDDKRKARLLRNRESAQLSRQRKKHYVEELEEKVRAMHSTIADLNNKISFIVAENAGLRQQLSGSGVCPALPPGMYAHPPMAPVTYPWTPCPPYVVNSRGSQVPLVPIPRLKPQQPVPAAKGKKSDTKKPTESRTKKVASISFLGLLFFILLFGGLVPIVDVRFGGLRDGFTYVGDRFYDQHRGRVLAVNGYLNGSDPSVGVRLSNGRFNTSSRRPCSEGIDCHIDRKSQESQHFRGSDEIIHMGNSSEPLVASLYVPRNDKLVKIDGNLIIHSVLATERATASQVNSKVNKSEDTSLAIPQNLAAALAIPEVGKNIGRHPQSYRSPTDPQRALGPGSTDALKDQLKSSSDGKLQQWFREGLAGPMLSSGMCTEVFQFDISPASASGAIIPASVVSNVSVEDHKNATRLKKVRNRRILRGIPVPYPGSDFNTTEEQVRKTSHKESFGGNKSVSSMVVSVLVDPREAGDNDGDGMMGPKSLSRIFVVVLIDSVKYVTYSCMLPRSGTHLVTT